MMKSRELLFKAKRVEAGSKNGEWVEGLPSYCSTDGTITKFERYAPGEFETLTIDPNTICQFTGLKDINGKRIYEDDILATFGMEDMLKKVSFAESDVYDYEDVVTDRVLGWCYERYPPKKNNIAVLLEQEKINRFEIEVVGNIWDEEKEEKSYVL